MGILLSVLSSYGPMARDVETLVQALKALCVDYMYELDPTIPKMPFKDEVSTYPNTGSCTPVVEYRIFHVCKAFILLYCSDIQVR